LRDYVNKKYFKKFLGLIIFLLFFSFYTYPYQIKDTTSNRPNANNFELEVGEELVYNVSYVFINLGQIRLKVLDKITTEEKVTYKTIAYKDSYRGIPFIDLHEIYESTLNQNIFSYKFRARSKTRSGTQYVIYDFDYPNRKAYFEHGKLDSVKIIEKYDTLNLKGYCQDGLSLFYFSRQNLYSGGSVNIPTVVNEKLSNTTINFYNKRTSVNIDAIKYPVDVIEFDGRADFEGIYGFKGIFEGWFSNDEARIPILAKMEVIIGKVRIELMSWKKKNWIPPRAKAQN